MARTSERQGRLRQKTPARRGTPERKAILMNAAEQIPLPQGTRTKPCALHQPGRVDDGRQRDRPPAHDSPGRSDDQLAALERTAAGTATRARSDYEGCCRRPRRRARAGHHHRLAYRFSQDKRKSSSQRPGMGYTRNMDTGAPPRRRVCWSTRAGPAHADAPDSTSARMPLRTSAGRQQEGPGRLRAGSFEGIARQYETRARKLAAPASTRSAVRAAGRQVTRARSDGLSKAKPDARARAIAPR